MPDPIQQSSRALDLSSRFVVSSTIVASPSAASETTICSLAIPANLAIATGVIVKASAAFTIGTNGVSFNLKIRQTNTSGATVCATGVITAAAASLVSPFIMGLDASPVGAQVYVATLTIASGSATSTVSAVTLTAIIV